MEMGGEKDEEKDGEMDEEKGGEKDVGMELGSGEERDVVMGVGSVTGKREGDYDVVIVVVMDVMMRDVA